MNHRAALFNYITIFSSLLSLGMAASIGVAKRACSCPVDKFQSNGTEINVFPYFECAYPTGTCDWSFVNNELENTAQPNCPPAAECTDLSACTCPIDKNGGTGAFINVGQAFQCAYPNGACTFNAFGDLMNALGQSNCPAFASCS